MRKMVNFPRQKFHIFNFACSTHLSDSLYRAWKVTKLLSTKKDSGSGFSSFIVKTSLRFSVTPNLVAGILGKTPDLRKLCSNCTKACLLQSLRNASARPTAALEQSCALGPDCISASQQMFTNTVTQSQADQDTDVIDKGQETVNPFGKRQEEKNGNQKPSTLFPTSIPQLPSGNSSVEHPLTPCTKKQAREYNEDLETKIILYQCPSYSTTTHVRFPLGFFVESFFGVVVCF